MVQLACDDPGILYSRAYHIEVNEQGRKYCWLGNDGPIQIVLPVAPSGPAQCALLIFCHPQVPIDRLRLIANDVERAAIITSPKQGVVVITFDVPESHASQLDVWLHNIPSVRPGDLGEGSDERLLAVGFYGAIVSFK